MAFLRRRTAQREGTIVAAASTIALRDPRKAAKQVGRRQEWQEDAWTMFDAIPEIKSSTWYVGNGLSKLRLYVGFLPADGQGKPVPVDDPDSGCPPSLATIATDELSRLRSNSGGQAEIIRELTTNLDVAGEGFIVGRGQREEVRDPITGDVVTPAMPEDWEVKSISEVVVDSQGTKVKNHPGDNGTLLDPDLDAAIRIYQRHPRWSGLADCHLRALLSDCEAILTLKAQQMSESRSRHHNGILTLANELSAGPRTAKDNPEDSSGEGDPLSKMVIEALLDPVDDPAAQGAVAPIILRGPMEAMTQEALRWVELGRKSGPELDARIEGKVQTVARGMNLPVEKVMGHQATTFANAAQIDADEFDDYYRPRAELIVGGVTTAYLVPNCVARDPSLAAYPDLWRLVVWYDPSELIRDPDPAEVADEAWDRFLISNDAYRLRKGISPDEAPDDTEVLARLGERRGILTADISKALLEFLGVPIEVEALPKPEATDSGGSEPADSGTQARQLPPEAVTAGATALLAVALASRVTDPSKREQAAALLSRLPERDLLALTTKALTSGRLTSAPQLAALPKGKVHPTAGRRLMDLDRDLRTRLLVLADDTMTRALEKAGNRIKAKAGRLRDLTRNAPPHMAASVVGRVLLADAGLTAEDLLAGAFDGMRAQFLSWGADAQRQALNIINEVVGGFDASTRAALGLRQAGDLEEAWTWLESTLTTLAHAQLFDPAPVVEAIGEVAAGVSVPPGVIRGAIARAGGAAGLTTDTDGHGAYVTLTDAGTRPAGGIGTGDLMTSALNDHGGSVEGYRWVYGPAARSRPFEEHEALDGAEFIDFADEGLANSGGFPGFGFYLPGDHGGCLCDVEPFVAGPPTTSTDEGD